MDAAWSDLAKEPLTQFVAAVLTIAGALTAWRQSRSSDATKRASDAAERANKDGQIAALETWKELLATERAARVRAEERADESAERAEAFSEERVRAMEAVWELRGQLKALNEALSKQNDELIRLRQQIRELEEKIDGRP